MMEFIKKQRKVIIFAVCVLLVIILLVPICRGFYAKSLYNKNEYYKAALEYKASLSIGKSDNILSCGKGLLNNKEYAKAVEVFELMSTEVFSEYHRYAKGLNYLSKSNFEKSVELLSTVSVEDSPKYLQEANFGKGKQLLEVGNYSDAKKCFDNATDISESKEMILNCTFLEAEDWIKKGYLNKAKAIYEKLPEGFTYKNNSKNNRLQLLAKYSDFVNLCGKWKATGECVVKSTATPRNYWHYYPYLEMSVFDRNKTDPDQYITVLCSINDKGQVRMHGNVEFSILTEHSSISQSDKSLEYSIDGLESLPKDELIDIVSSGTKKITCENDAIYLHYYKLDLDYNIALYEDSTQESDYTYGKRVEVY